MANGESGMQVVAGDFGRQVESTFREITMTALKAGHRVVVDNADGHNETNAWRCLLGSYMCLFVGVYCSLDVLCEREAARADRMPGSSAEQFYRVHDGARYDMTVDTTHTAAVTCAAEIVRCVASR